MGGGGRGSGRDRGAEHGFVSRRCGMAATVNRRPPCLAFAGIVVALLIVHELVLEQNLMTLGQVVQQDEATDAAPALQRQQVGQTDGDAKILTLQAEQIKLLEEQIAILRRAYSGSSGSPPAASKTPSPPAAPTHAPTPVPAGGAEPPTPPMPPPTPPTVMAPPPSSASQPAGADAPTAGPPDTPPATQNLANNKATPHWKNTLLLIAFNCAPCDTYRAPGTIARLASLYGQDFQVLAHYFATVHPSSWLTVACRCSAVEHCVLWAPSCSCVSE